MARRKHTAALFEVYHDQKARESRGTAASRVSGWWFKNRATPEGEFSAAVEVENDPTARGLKSPLIVAPRIAAVEAMEPPLVVVPVAPAAPKAPKVSPVPPARESVRAPADPTRPSWFAGRFHLDQDSREITMRLPVTTLIIAGFSFMVLLGLAYVLGRHAATPTEAATSEMPTGGGTGTPTDDSRQPRAVQPSALDVPRRVSRPVAAAAQRTTDDSRFHEHETGGSAPMANSVHGLPPVSFADAGAVDGPRIIGLNYVIVQSYPSEQTAEEAHDFLTKSGVSCTVEQGPADFTHPNWFSVVSTHGFERIHTRDCESLQQKIETLGEKFAGNAKFKRFEPHLYKWK